MNNNPNIEFKNKESKRRLFMPPRDRKKGTGTIFSSNGEIEVNLNTGKIIKVHTDSDGFRDWADNVTFFDIDEYRDYYGDVGGRDDSFDILDLGFWRKKGSYVPPSDSFRIEIDRDYEEDGF
jgi:hypothetical protein